MRGLLSLSKKSLFRSHLYRRLAVGSGKRNVKQGLTASASFSTKKAAQCFFSTATYDDCEYQALRDRKQQYDKEIQGLPEMNAMNNVESFLQQKAMGADNIVGHDLLTSLRRDDATYKHMMDSEEIKATLDAAMATFCLHVESRIAAMIGRGYYTIGPCGEEMLSSVGLILEPKDSSALHYRHLGINITRQLKKSLGPDATIDRNELLSQILMDRARGYTVSKHDPVTGGVHCSIGTGRGNDDDILGGGDYIVTSTLASQCTSAVGRALGYGRRQQHLQPQQRESTPVSFVTLGDGSIHNHHFWSAFHLARHAKHRNIKCPVLFGISDNGISISYSTEGYVYTLFGNEKKTDPLVKHFIVNGQDMMDVYDKTNQAIEYTRRRSSPAVIVYSNLQRRFGHAATDRQFAYLNQEEINTLANIALLEMAMYQAVEQFSAYSNYNELYDRFKEIQHMTAVAFEEAILESEQNKVTRDDMLSRVFKPMQPIPRLPSELLQTPTPDEPTATVSETESSEEKPKKKGKRKDVMRKQMTRVVGEIMDKDHSVVYIGEDVEHGGYYLVTEGIKKKFPSRIIDFPPDETSLLGAAMGFAQVGYTPIIEIPYVKYLDCGLDKYTEIAIMNWLSNGQLPNGMIVRLQGFDLGTFGGNYHTHNQLPHIPPGIDVLCYSNGEDYVRGFRNAYLQAKAGRVVCLVDCTALLNLRHIYEQGDCEWLRSYPALQDDKLSYDENPDSLLHFHDIRRYGTSSSTDGNKKIAIVSYGNGVVTALQARNEIISSGLVDSNDVDVLDCPYISETPVGLKEAVSNYDGIVFADICKDGPGGNILPSMVTNLQQEGLLYNNYNNNNISWDFAAAPRTYNPLGSTVTFLNANDIMESTKRVLSRMN